MKDKIEDIKTTIHDIKVLIILEHEILYQIEVVDQYPRAVRKVCGILFRNYSQLDALYEKLDAEEDVDDDDLDDVVQLIDELSVKVNLELDSLVE